MVAVYPIWGSEQYLRFKDFVAGYPSDFSVWPNDSQGHVLGDFANGRKLEPAIPM